MDIPKFSDISERKSIDGDKVKIEDLLNKEIFVTDFQVTASKYKGNGGNYCTKVQFYTADNEERRVFFSGSEVIREQIEDMKKRLDEKELPFLFKTTLKRLGNYYSFT